MRFAPAYDNVYSNCRHISVQDPTFAKEAPRLCLHHCEPEHTAGTCGTYAAAHTAAAPRALGSALLQGHHTAARRAPHKLQLPFSPGQILHLSQHPQSPEEPALLPGRDSDTVIAPGFAAQLVAVVNG